MRTAKMPHIRIKLFASCLWCEKEIDFKQNMNGKMICSKKCLTELKAACEKQNGPGTCGYDMTDVVKQRRKAK